MMSWWMASYQVGHAMLVSVAWLYAVCLCVFVCIVWYAVSFGTYLEAEAHDVVVNGLISGRVCPNALLSLKLLKLSTHTHTHTHTHNTTCAGAAALVALRHKSAVRRVLFLSHKSAERGAHILNDALQGRHVLTA